MNPADHPFSLREKVAEGRMRGQQSKINQHFPLTLTLSFRPLRSSWRGDCLQSLQKIRTYQPKGAKIMEYTPKEYDSLIGMAGFSETILRNHFTLYEGYVNNTNRVFATLEQLLNDESTAFPEYAELKRRLGWEFNGMRLHEYYFENLGGKTALDKECKLVHKLIKNFGSFEAWEKDFRGTGAIRGIGWAVLYQDLSDDRLINFWINEHDVSHPVGCKPLLVMDLFEHAFISDYELKRTEYINAFFKNIDWQLVDDRLE